MLIKLIDRLKGIRTIAPINAERFNDSIALKTSWSPLKKGGTNFRTHKLVSNSQSRIEFKPTFLAVFFYMIFSVVGLGIVGLGIYYEIQISFNLEIGNIILFVMGLIFFTFGITFGYFGTKPIVFDKELGYYWKGRKKPNLNLEFTNPELFTPLNDIHALQIISEYIQGDKSSYYSYELNLIFRNGNRRNVIDHGSLASIREDAQKVSQFINRPVLDNVI